jgi:aspartyl-tRNA(Asn)/glutamyl-tRNA(Gln) amidotransferase subunit C
MLASRAMSGPTVDRAMVLHVAKLASLSLTDDEADRFADELATIVGYVAQIEALDTTGVEPTAHVQLDRAALRADEPRPCLTHEEALAAAPSVEDGGFGVPAFVEDK